MTSVNRVVSHTESLPGRSNTIAIDPIHAVLGTKIIPPFNGYAQLVVGMGCFWGAERLFWNIDGVYTTSVGYSGGTTPNPRYEEVCTGYTGHTEVVQIVYDSQRVSLQALLQIFWQSHDPTTPMRQGNDVGSQYRSAIYVNDQDTLATVTESKLAYEKDLKAANRGPIATEIKIAGPYYFAETHHQQYLHKVPNGYCGLAGTGISYKID